MNNPDSALKEHGYNEPELVTTTSILKVITAAMTATLVGVQLNQFLLAQDISNVPNFILVLFVGIFITNIFEFSPKLQFQQQSLDLVNMISLSLFLSIAMMSLKLWELLDLAIPLFIIIAVQAIVLILYTVHITFRALGKDYQAATIVGGHIGFGLGATPTAMANIDSITHRYGPAPYGIFIVLIVGAFFIDIANALIIQVFVSLLGT